MTCFQCVLAFPIVFMYQQEQKLFPDIYSENIRLGALNNFLSLSNFGVNRLVIETSAKA